ncbi:MAG: phosphatidylserine/phosphatidylglycerophosphate/cardiolipin synthase-like enzyme, partial [Myxococcota bacterium]
ADDRISLIGSNNRDVLSLLLGQELTVEVDDRAFARRVRRMMAEDFGASRRITPREAMAWRKQSQSLPNIGPWDWQPRVLSRLLLGVGDGFLEGELGLRAPFTTL